MVVVMMIMMIMMIYSLYKKNGTVRKILSRYDLC